MTFKLFKNASRCCAYPKVSCELAADKAAREAGKWKSDLDDEILQKILPRLRGSRTRVGPLLGALGCYLHSGDKAGVEKFFPAPGEELPEKLVQEIIALNISTYGNKSIHSTPSQPTKKQRRSHFPPKLRQSATHGPRGHRRAIRELHMLRRPS